MDDTEGCVMKVMVEWRNDRRVEKFMKPLTVACRELGHEAFRWKTGPFARPPCKVPPVSDVALIWNGMDKYRRYRPIWKERGTKLLIAELGWCPQTDTFQLDKKGFNMESSWARDPILFEPKTPILVKDLKEILVVLQLNIDTQIRLYSPHFKSMAEFMRHLIQWVPEGIKIVARRHPRHKPTKELIGVVEASDRCCWDPSKSFGEALDRYPLVALINSSSGVEAIQRHKSLLCFGDALYRHEGAVVCMDGDGEKLRETLAKPVKLWTEAMDSVWERLSKRQWRISDLPGRLAPYLGD